MENQTNDWSESQQMSQYGKLHPTLSTSRSILNPDQIVFKVRYRGESKKVAQPKIQLSYTQLTREMQSRFNIETGLKFMFTTEDSETKESSLIWNQDTLEMAAENRLSVQLIITSYSFGGNSNKEQEEELPSAQILYMLIQRLKERRQIFADQDLPELMQSYQNLKQLGVLKTENYLLEYCKQMQYCLETLRDIIAQPLDPLKGSLRASTSSSLRASLAGSVKPFGNQQLRVSNDSTSQNSSDNQQQIGVSKSSIFSLNSSSSKTAERLDRLRYRTVNQKNQNSISASVKQESKQTLQSQTQKEQAILSVPAQQARSLSQDPKQLQSYENDDRVIAEVDSSKEESRIHLQDLKVDESFLIQGGNIDQLNQTNDEVNVSDLAINMTTAIMEKYLNQPSSEHQQ